MLGGSGGVHSSSVRLRAACLPPGGVVLRLVPPGAGVLVEPLRELATRGKRTSTSSTGSGKGAGARVAVRSVLEDHETAILELERLANDVDLFGRLQSDLHDIVFKKRDKSRAIAELGFKLTKLEDDLELRVDEIAKSVLDGSTELQVLARSVRNLEQWSDEVAYRHLRPLHDRVTHLEHCLS